MSEDKDAELQELRAWKAKMLRGVVDMAQRISTEHSDFRAKIARLEADVAGLTNALAESGRTYEEITAPDRERALRAKVALLESEIARLRRDWEAMNKAADRFCADWKRSESRLSALEAAASEFVEAEKRIAWTSAEQSDADVERFHAAATALDALLSGEEGR